MSKNNSPWTHFFFTFQNSEHLCYKSVEEKNEIVGWVAWFKEEQFNLQNVNALILAQYTPL